MNNEGISYRNTITEIMDEILGEIETIQKASRVVAESIAKEEPIHVIGPGGHSNMAAEEVLWRAGGLAPINAILDPGTNLIHGAKRSNFVERLPGYATRVFDAYR